MIIHVPRPTETPPPRSGAEVMAETMAMVREDPGLLAYAGLISAPPPPPRNPEGGPRNPEEAPRDPEEAPRNPDSPKFSSFTESKRDLLAHIAFDVSLWELCTPLAYDGVAPLTDEQTEKAVDGGIEYLRELGLGVHYEVIRGCHYLQVNDAGSIVDDEEMSRSVMEATGVKSSWYVHRLSDYFGNFDELARTPEKGVNPEKGVIEKGVNPEKGVIEKGVNPEKGVIEKGVIEKGVIEKGVNPEKGVIEKGVNPEKGVIEKGVNPEKGVIEKGVIEKVVTPGTRGPYKKKAIVCGVCKMTFTNKSAKANHTRRGKCQQAHTTAP